MSVLWFRLRRRIRDLENKLEVIERQRDLEDDAHIDMLRTSGNERRALEAEATALRARVRELETKVEVTMRAVPELVRHAIGRIDV